MVVENISKDTGAANSLSLIPVFKNELDIESEKPDIDANRGGPQNMMWI